MRKNTPARRLPLPPARALCANLGGANLDDANPDDDDDDDYTPYMPKHMRAVLGGIDFSIYLDEDGGWLPDEELVEIDPDFARKKQMVKPLKKKAGKTKGIKTKKRKQANRAEAARS
jgi:hypothetical protein